MAIRMISSRLPALARRRQYLQQQVAQQRTTLANDVRPLLPLLSAIDSGRQVRDWIRGHPGLSLGAVIVFAILKPRFAFRWVRRSFLLWQMWRRIRRLAHR